MEKRAQNAAIVAVSYKHDIPHTREGSLIPGKRFARVPVKPSYLPSRGAILFVSSVLFFALSLGVTAFNTISATMSVAAPIVVVDTNEPEPVQELQYGTRVSLSEPNFFAETKQGFVDAKTTFIEADLSAMKLRFYEAGEVKIEVPILSKGKEGSWWETPAGLYAIETKSVNHFSSFGKVWQPWSMAFQGNFFIHGWPYYPDGTPVPEGFSGGCIRLADEDVKKVYELAPVGTPVLVHEKDFESDGFVYEPKVPNVNAEHYLLADINNSTVLASSDMDTKVPIASVTKLMTALVAAEHINLDKDVRITQERYVTTLVPRLEGRRTASMYSLLQLLLVESSNEAAEVIASQVGRERFITLMNEKAESLGLENTTFADPSGLDNGNTSSLRDLLRLTQYIYNNRSFIFELSVNENITSAYRTGDFGELQNFNLVDGVENMIGGKVGETLAAGQTSVSLHELTVKDSKRIIAVVLLHSTDRPADVRRLLQYVSDRFGAE
jgi:serine-type D-Ala-D-Ala carboxypeptidase (penicillin-binding protein 5/6)